MRPVPNRTGAPSVSGFAFSQLTLAGADRLLPGLIEDIGALGKVEDFLWAQEASAKAIFKLSNTYQALQGFIY
jgi:hypothetical protein